MAVLLRYFPSNHSDAFPSLTNPKFILLDSSSRLNKGTYTKDQILGYIMKVVFQDPTFSLELLRAIGETYYKGADIGECLSTAYRIKEGDFESWHQEWLKTARRINKYADESLAAGHTVSACEAYLRACNYYRAAEFFLVNPTDSRIQTTWGK